MTFNKITVFSLLIALSPGQVMARNYAVEAIIFSQPVATDSATVQWNDRIPRNIRAQNKLDKLYRQAEDAALAREEAQLDATSTVPQTADQPKSDEAIPLRLSSDLLELKNIQLKLEENPDFQILKTLSWQQSEADYQNSPLITTLSPHMMGVIRVYAPNLLYAAVNLTYVPDEILPKSLAQNSAEGITELAATTAPVPGSPEIAPGYDNTPTIETVARPPLAARYFIDEQRKLRLNEIHYFDHPRFGVILSVKPIEEPKPNAS